MFQGATRVETMVGLFADLKLKLSASLAHKLRGEELDVVRGRDSTVFSSIMATVLATLAGESHEQTTAVQFIKSVQFNMSNKCLSLLGCADRFMRMSKWVCAIATNKRTGCAQLHIAKVRHIGSKFPEISFGSAHRVTTPEKLRCASEDRVLP